MRIEELRDKVREWDLKNDLGVAVATAKFSFILNQIEHYAARDWKIYLPAEYPTFNPNYLDRLARWIGNLTSEVDQQLLFEAQKGILLAGTVQVQTNATYYIAFLKKVKNRN